MNVTKWMPGVAWDAAFTIGSAGATMTCSIQLKDFAGNNLTAKNAIDIYYSTDATGLAVETMGAETVLATHGIILIETTQLLAKLITEEDGVVALTLDGDGATETYVNVILPNGKVVTSTVLAFNA